jgi:hypothetical protein
LPAISSPSNARKAAVAAIHFGNRRAPSCLLFLILTFILIPVLPFRLRRGLRRRQSNGALAGGQAGKGIKIKGKNKLRSKKLLHKKTDKAKEPDTVACALRQRTRMMKKRLILLSAVAGTVCLAAIGCSNKNIDTAKVREAFQSLSGEPKQQLEQALTAIEASNYVAAIKPLRGLGYSIKMDVKQRKILEDTMNKVNAKAAAQK